jgi:hypothetical protein
MLSAESCLPLHIKQNGEISTALFLGWRQESSYICTIS